MFSAFTVILAFVCGTIVGAALITLGIYLGTPREEYAQEPEQPPEAQPRHRPIAGSNIGPDAVRSVPRSDSAVPGHRPISG